MNPVFSIIDFADLHEGIDFDPEHYHPTRLIAAKRISINAANTVSDYFDEVVDICDPLVGANVYDLTDALGCFLSGDGQRSILSAKKAVRPRDVIVSRLRSYLREICIVPDRGPLFRPYVSTEFLVFRAKQGFSEWLLPFFLTDEVQTILHWSQTGNNHPRVHASSVLQLPVTRQLTDLTGHLAKLANSALQIYEGGLHAYPEAESELLDRIGWTELAARPFELFYIQDFETLFKRERLDAEHYQPKYGRLRERLRKLNAPAIGSFSPTPRRGVQPEFCESGTVSVIDSKAVRPRGVEPNKTDLTSTKFYSSTIAKKGRIIRGDVLLNSTGLGTLGRASFYDSNDPALADNHVAIIHPDPNYCLPVYLSLFLNSPAGLAQSEMFQTGSSGQLELYPQHIRKILVFLPKTKTGKIDLNWQEKLTDKVLAAARARTEARAKLDEAKRIIENVFSEKR